ncbi:MAG: phage tail assembly protein [Pseudomonadota bacterium]|nr:phage tail assembly protein [Pseudomonadota bacterium]
MAKVILSRPIQRGDTQITELVLTEPNAGSLRGTRLTDLLNGDVDAVVTVLPRISDQAIQKHEIAKMSARDLAMITGEIMAFFMDEDPQTDQASSTEPE